MSERRSTSLWAAGSDFFAALAFPFCAGGAAAGAGARVAPPPKMSSRSNKLGSPPDAAGTESPASSPPKTTPMPSSDMSPLRSSRFLCMSLISTTGIRASASFAADRTLSLTGVVPPSPPPPKISSSSPPPAVVNLTETPVIALMSAPYSQDRSCNSKDCDPSDFLTNLCNLSKVSASATSANLSLNLAKHVNALCLTSKGHV
mmetsp:Transcript_1119/g.2429  ORF Transcript_1119/g.2429 Transcript_1119/m.2429 type:complete len:203 (+) Transcript_1119:510-1118(+)